jgi:galactokinase
VNLIGEHTDYAQGLALPFALDRHVLVAAAARTDGRLVARSGQADGDGWQAYPEAVRAVAVRRGLLAATAGADLLVDSDVPIGAGLSSSAALEVAVALALTGLHDVDPGRIETAKLCQEAEHVATGTPTGLLDQLASLLADAGSAVLLDFRDLSWRAVPLQLGEFALLVVDTGVAHRVGDGPYAERHTSVQQAAERCGVASLRDADEAQLERLPEPLRRRARHVVRENARVRQAVDLLERGEVEALGPVLTASHESLRDDFEVSSPELDCVVDSALAAGSLGARLTGAGFGGSAIALVRRADAERIGQQLREAFAAREWPGPAILPGTAGSGARRLR